MTNESPSTRKLILKMSVSLDGFVCGQNGEVDWIFRSSGSKEGTEWVLDTLLGAGVHIMGSRSYHDMAAFWPFSDMPFAPPMNDIPKMIFSKDGLRQGLQRDLTTEALTEAEARSAHRHGVAPTAGVLRSSAEPDVASGDLVEEISNLKAQPGNYILAHGGARFTRSLAASGLVDEYRLGIHPVLLGQGEPLLAGLRAPVDLRLISAATFSSGAMGVVYLPAEDRIC